MKSFNSFKSLNPNMKEAYSSPTPNTSLPGTTVQKVFPRIKAMYQRKHMNPDNVVGEMMQGLQPPVKKKLSGDM